MSSFLLKPDSLYSRSLLFPTGNISILDPTLYIRCGALITTLWTDIYCTAYCWLCLLSNVVFAAHRLQSTLHLAGGPFDVVTTQCMARRHHVYTALLHLNAQQILSKCYSRALWKVLKASGDVLVASVEHCWTRAALRLSLLVLKGKKIRGSHYSMVWVMHILWSGLSVLSNASVLYSSVDSLRYTHMLWYCSLFTRYHQRLIQNHNKTQL